MNDVENRKIAVKITIHTAFATALMATLLVGCSADPSQQDTKTAYRAPVYRTGSQIPVGRESPGDSSSSSDNAPNDWQNMLPHTAGHCPGGS